MVSPPWKINPSPRARVWYVQNSNLGTLVAYLMTLFFKCSIEHPNDPHAKSLSA